MLYRSTLLQIIFLISNLERGMMILKSNRIVDILMDFFNKFSPDIETNENIGKNNNHITFVEEILLFNILLKVLLDDHKLVGSFLAKNGIAICLKIFEKGEIKKHLDEPILAIFSYGIKEMQFCDTFEENLKKVD